MRSVLGLAVATVAVVLVAVVLARPFDDLTLPLSILAAIGMVLGLAAMVAFIPQGGCGDAILGGVSAILVTVWKFPLWLGILLAPLAFLIGTLLGAAVKGI